METFSITPEPIKVREGDSDEAILKEARERATEANTYWKETFESAKDDELFIASKQWDEEALAVREEEGRPSLVINQFQQYISRVSGAQRKQVQEIQISPVEANSKESTIKTVGNQDVTVSKVLEGVIRNIQATSNASRHYKKAYRHALTGIGFLRVLTDRSRQDSYDVDIKIEAVSNRWSVLMGPAKEDDYSDSDYAFVFEKLSREEFKKRYPNATVGEFDNTNDESNDWWQNSKTITVAEYFRREPVTRTLLLLSDGNTVYKDKTEKVLDELEEQGITVVRERTVKTYKVIWSKITANSILEKDIEFPTSTIPIVPVLGREVNIEGKKKYTGLVTNAKDAQIMLNYWMSAATERISLAPKTPYIAEAEAIEGHETQWKQANTKNFAILKYNKGFSRPQREAPPPMPIAEMQMAQNMQDSIQSTIGIYDASIGKAGNETSGRAILARQNEAQEGTFEFDDNLANAMRRIGILCVELIPSVYDTERILRIKNPDGSGDFVEINKVVPDEETGEEVVINDLALGKYDVAITSGTSFATKRIETANSMFEFMKAVPQSAQIAGDLIAENMDFVNSDAIAERLKKMLPPNVLSPEEQEELQKNSPKPEAPPPSPEQIKAEADIKLKQMDMESKQAEGEYKIQLENIKLQTAQLNLEAKQFEVIEKMKEAQGKKNEEIAKKIAEDINKGA